MKLLGLLEREREREIEREREREREKGRENESAGGDMKGGERRGTFLLGPKVSLAKVLQIMRPDSFSQLSQPWRAVFPAIWFLRMLTGQQSNRPADKFVESYAFKRDIHYFEANSVWKKKKPVFFYFFMAITTNLRHFCISAPALGYDVIIIINQSDLTCQTPGSDKFIWTTDNERQKDRGTRSFANVKIKTLKNLHKIELGRKSCNWFTLHRCIENFCDSQVANLLSGLSLGAACQTGRP